MISNMLLTTSTVLFPLITFPYITRTLSNASIGKFFFIDAFTQYFVTLSAVGIPYYGIREIAKIKNDAAQRSKLVAELITIQFTLAVVSSIILLIAHYFIADLKNEHGLVKVACLSIIGSSFLIEWFYQGMENFAYITTRSLILKTLSVLSILLLVKQQNDYLIYYLLTTLLIVANASFNFFNYAKNHHVPFTGKLELKRHIKPLLVLLSINISVNIYAVSDTIILGLLTNTVMVSYYNVPLKIARIFWMLVNGAGLVLIPRIANFFAEDDTRGIQNVMQKNLNIVFLLTLPFCCFCLLFPEEIINVVSGPQYLQSANALRILSGVPFIIAVCNVFGTQYLMPIGSEKSILHATVIGLIISLVLNFLLIPQFKFMGTAIACVAAELVVGLYIVKKALKTATIELDYGLILQIGLSLLATIISRYILIHYLDGVLLVIGAIAVYCFVFLLLQLLIFKNQFIFSLVQFKKTNLQPGP